jgi:hypothetical protein
MCRTFMRQFYHPDGCDVMLIKIRRSVKCVIWFHFFFASFDLFAQHTLFPQMITYCINFTTYVYDAINIIVALSFLQDDGSPVSIFSLSGSNPQDRHLVAGRNGVKRLRTVSY